MLKAVQRVKRHPAITKEKANRQSHSGPMAKSIGPLAVRTNWDPKE